ncbi:MAG: metalloprotease TldD [Lautropia sp.]|nr:metalloprotease TldD [Lautropia sp.]
MNLNDPAINHLSVARATLLEPYNLDEAHLAQAIGTIFEHKVDYADLYFQYTRSEGWSLDEGIVKSGSFSIEQGVGVRAVSGDKTAFAYSDEINAAALDSAARATRTIARTGAGGRARILQAATGASTERSGHSLYPMSDPIASLDSAGKVALLHKIEKHARARDPRIIQVMAGLAAEHDIVMVMRSDGVMAADVRPLIRSSVQVIAEQNGRREQGSSGGGGRFDLDYFTDAVIERYVEEAVQSALVNLESRPAPAGVMSVVLGPGWPGVLIHEAIGHGLEGDFNRKRSSAFAGRLGQRVAAKGVTVVDDGTIRDRRGSLNIDDEGNATQCNVLIEDGVLKGYLQDSLNARLMKVPVTGNGRRESFAHLPMPRMTNTFMYGGDKDPKEIIGSLERGIYAANFGGGQVDITNGKFVFSASEAYWVEDGRIQYPVKGATIVGNGPDALTRVTMIGNDMQLDSGIGVCGKDGQSVPVGVGQPTLRIEGLTVGGTA